MLALTACSGVVTSPGPTEAVSPGTTVATPIDTTVTTVADITVTTVADGAQFDTGEVTVGDHELRVWVADDPAERGQGLRQVEELPADVDGMLFVWETPTQAVFGMKDTLIPLDVWFFDEEGVLLGSHAMTPCIAEPCPGYPAPGAVRWALETPQGSIELGEGDRLSAFPSS